nr:MMPL family transporter [Micromonospora sp. DSM 115978]
QAVLSMVPVMIAVGTSSLIAVAAGFELSPLTVVGGPLVIALCTEFTALIIMRHLEERRRGESPRVAVHTAAARTGRAFVVSALTAIVGIAVLASSPLPLLRDFGITVAMNVGVALLSALVVLPPLLIWADELGWVHRGGPSRRDGERARFADEVYGDPDDGYDGYDGEDGDLDVERGWAPEGGVQGRGSREGARRHGSPPARHGAKRRPAGSPRRP